MATCDGFLVVSRALATGSVVPPYRYQYNHEHFRALADAEERIAELEAGDWPGWSLVTLTPCSGGVPLGARRIL